MKQDVMTQDQFEELARRFLDENETIKQFGKTIEYKRFSEHFYHSGTIAFSFKNCIFSDRFSLVNLTTQAPIYFEHCVFSDDLIFSEVHAKCRISFLNCTIEKTFVVSNSAIDNMQLNNNFSDRIIFGAENFFGHLEIGGKEENEIGDLSLHPSIIQNTCTIDHVRFLNLRISYSSLKNELNIFNCRINCLAIDNFRNNGFLRFLNCESWPIENTPSSITFSRSNLGKAEFLNFKFSSFQRINIVHSILLDSVYIGSTWTKNIVSDPYTQPINSTKSLLADSEYYATLRDIYKQIKHAMAKQGNVVEEQYFHGLEMNAYEQSLHFQSNFWTKLTLRLSFHTSNYGQSLLRPILVLVIVNGLLLSLLRYVIGFHFIGLQNIGFKQLLQEFADFVWFMNPLHKNNPEFTNLPLLLDVTIRIISSYCIYNIVRATRRFIK